MSCYDGKQNMIVMEVARQYFLFVSIQNRYSAVVPRKIQPQLSLLFVKL